MNGNHKKLPIEFYQDDLLMVAKNLLGKIFVFNDKRIGKKLSAKIVEVEAYDGRIDKSAHTFNGKRKEIKLCLSKVVICMFTLHMESIFVQIL